MAAFFQVIKIVTVAFLVSVPSNRAGRGFYVTGCFAAGERTGRRIANFTAIGTVPAPYFYASN